MESKLVRRFSITLVLIFCLFALLLVLSGCIYKPYQFIYDVSEISAIKLVTLTTMYYESHLGEYDVLAEIKDIDAFLEEFNLIKFGYMIGDPDFPPTGANVILITYQNGDLEGVHYYCGQFTVKNGKCDSGRRYCDKNEYEQFFSDWLRKSL